VNRHRTTSPFPSQGPLAPDQVTGRDDLVALVAKHLAERRPVAVVGPRGYGKTSLLRRVQRDLDDAGIAPVWIDLYALTSMIDLAARIDEGLVGIRGALGPVVERMAAGAFLRLGGVALEQRRAGRRRPDPARTVASQLTVLARAGSEDPVAVVLDEMAYLERVEGAPALVRHGLGDQRRELAVAVTATHACDVRVLFGDPGGAGGEAVEVIEVAALAPEVVIELVVEGFDRSGRRPGPLPERVAELAGGHPRRTMQLADAAWRRTPPGGQATAQTWDDTVESTRRAVAGDLEWLYSTLSPGQQKVLRSLAHHGTVYGTGARLHDLAKGTATEARRALEAQGHLVRRGTGCSLVDPLFADWIRQRFPL